MVADQLQPMDNEVPQDLNAFFGHPLNSDGEDKKDSSLALLHEFRNLPAIEREEPAPPLLKSKRSEQNKLNSPLCKGELVDWNELTFDAHQAEIGDIVNDAPLSSGDQENPNMSVPENVISKLLNMDNVNNVSPSLLDFYDLGTENQDDTDELAALQTMDSFITDSSTSPVQQMGESAPDFKAKVTSTTSPQTQSPANPLFPENMPTIPVPNIQMKQETLSTPASSMQQQHMHPPHPDDKHPMLTQVMPIQVVDTSSGPLQIQPFYYNGGIGFTPIPPYGANNAMPQNANLRPRLPMPWTPSYYPYSPNGGGRMMTPNGMRMAAPPMYCGPPDYYMMRPGYPGGPPHRMIYQSPSSLPVCQQILLQKQGQASLGQPKPEHSMVELPLALPEKYTMKKSIDSAEQKDMTTSCLVIPAAAVSHLKSPDSGFGENTLDLPVSSSESEISGSNPGSPTDPQVSAGKKRRSSLCTYSRQASTTKSQANNQPLSTLFYPKRQEDHTGYHMYLEAATSCSARLEDDRMTYLNKGQTYSLIMENNLPQNMLKHSTAKSVVSLGFREHVDAASAAQFWDFWLSRQEEESPHGIDFDITTSEGIIDGTMEHMGVNALSFTWNLHKMAKVPIAVHCLSTDFSNQKGVKGLPLHIQIDTYEDRQLVHRAYAQIKIFCDKGAERKARDEEKKKDKGKPGDIPGVKPVIEQYHPVCGTTQFYSMQDLSSKAFIYNLPKPDGCEDLQDLNSEDGLDGYLDSDELAAPSKMLKMMEVTILIFVREENINFYIPLLLKSPTITGLCEAIHGKYHEKYPDMKNIRRLFKRTLRGIMVQMDDNMVRLLGYESSYVLNFVKCSDGCYEVTLVELEL